MKKLTVIAFVLFIGLTSSIAQVSVSPGFRGGLNLSTLTNIDDNRTKTDFYIGGLVNIKFNKYFSLQPEITYSRQDHYSDNHYCHTQLRRNHKCRLNLVLI